MPHLRFASGRRLTQVTVVDRHIAPTQVDLTKLSNDFLQHLLLCSSFLRIRGQKDATSRIVAGFGQINSLLPRNGVEEFVRHGHQHAGTITGLKIAAAATSMIQIHADFQSTLDDLVGRNPFHIHQKANSTVVMLSARIVQALRRWQPRRPIRFFLRHKFLKIQLFYSQSRPNCILLVRPRPAKSRDS